jgi:ankyrin repeat protein
VQLLGHDADIEARDTSERTPLLLAAYWGSLHLVHLLLRNQVDVNARDRHHRSALFIAAQRGLVEVVEALVQKKITDVNTR